MKLKGKVALVTGAGSGMGQAIAVLFAQEGAKVSVVDIDAAIGQKTVNLIKQNDGQGQFIKADVATSLDVERMIKTTVAAYDRLDILVNNAGAPMWPTPVDEVDENLYDRIMAVNVKAIYLSGKYVIPIMKEQGGGGYHQYHLHRGSTTTPRLECLLRLQGLGNCANQSTGYRTG